jgi:distribution and morphology protein 31
LKKDSIIINQLRYISFNPSKKISKFFHNLNKFWLKIKWILIRSKRPFNLEDIGAFISWLLTGNIMLFLIGTTTFVSLVLMTINKLTNRDYVAEWLGNLITKNTNLTVSFESAISPDWKYGTILLKNCIASKRPKVIKRIEKIEKSIDGKILNKTFEDIYDDGNYTQFDLTIEEISVSLSFWRWISGKGFIHTASIKCVRGIIDRTHVVWKEGDDPRNYKNFYRPGDWEIEKYKVDDVLLTIYHPNGFRPCQLSIYNADLDGFRKNWVMLDSLTCNHLSGCYDGSLFTINKISNFDNFKEELKIDSLVNKKLGREQFTKIPFDKNNFQKIVRFRMDNLKIEHLNKGMTGPVGWINKGTVDIIADIMVLEKNITLDMLLDEGLNNFSNQFLYNKNKIEKKVEKEKVKGNDNNKEKEIDLNNLFICDFYLRLKNPKAQVPLFTNDLSYINNAAIRPIVGYINNNKTFIPIRGRIYKDLSDFDGSWTFYDSLFMDDLSEGIYQSFYEYVADEKLRNERLKKVGFWSLQFVLQFILWSLTTLSG